MILKIWDKTFLLLNSKGKQNTITAETIIYLGRDNEMLSVHFLSSFLLLQLRREGSLLCQINSEPHCHNRSLFYAHVWVWCGSSGSPLHCDSAVEAAFILCLQGHFSIIRRANSLKSKMDRNIRPLTILFQKFTSFLHIFYSTELDMWLQRDAGGISTFLVVCLLNELDHLSLFLLSLLTFMSWSPL